MIEIDIDMAAVKAICRGKNMGDALQRVGKSIALDAKDQAARSAGNTPRHIHPWSLNAGLGYGHYDRAIEVHRGMDGGMAASYVMATRHAIWLEFGWTPVDRNGNRGEHQPARFYLTNALWLNKEDA